MSETIVSDHTAAIQEAQTLLASDLLILDTETTGLRSHDEVIEIAIVNLAGETLFHSLVNPATAISADAQAVHGISYAELEQAPLFDEIWPDVQALLTSHPFASYNSDFDARLLYQTARRAGVDLPVGWSDNLSCCLMTLYATFWGERGRYGDYRWQSLSSACQQQGIAPGNHRALGDALAALAILKAMAASKQGEDDNDLPF